MLEAVERVDSAMTRIRDAGKVRARERIAVLAALNIAFDLLDVQTQNTALSQQADEARAEAAAAQQPSSAQAALDWDEPRLQAIMQRLDAAVGTASGGL